MKSVALLIALLCGLVPALAAATRPAVAKVSILGKEYYRIDQWSRANGFQWKWLSKNEAQVWNASMRMHFTTDSRRMTLNGVTILLSEAMRNQGGVPHVAYLDITTALQPLIFPPKNRAGQKVKHICIDPGHGGKEPGYIVGTEQEKKYTLLLAQELGGQLRRAGYTVSFTRTTDVNVELPERPAIARKRRADLFISLHFNSAGFRSSTIGGVEVYCMTPQRANSTNDRGTREHNLAFAGNVNNPRNMVLAYQIQKSLIAGTGQEDRGVKRARFAVLRDAEMPAVLIEGGFLSNPNEARKIFNAAWRKQMAASIVTGIQSYRRLVET